MSRWSPAEASQPFGLQVLVSLHVAALVLASLHVVLWVPVSQSFVLWALVLPHVVA